MPRILRAIQRGATNTCIGLLKKCRLVAFDQVPEPSEGKRRGNQQQGDDPVKPDHDDRREANGNGDHVQGAINGVAVRTVHNANTAPSSTSRLRAEIIVPNGRFASLSFRTH